MNLLTQYFILLSISFSYVHTFSLTLSYKTFYFCPFSVTDHVLHLYETRSKIIVLNITDRRLKDKILGTERWQVFPNLR